MTIANKRHPRLVTSVVAADPHPTAMPPLPAAAVDDVGKAGEAKTTAEVVTERDVVVENGMTGMGRKGAGREMARAHAAAHAPARMSTRMAARMSSRVATRMAAARPGRCDSGDKGRGGEQGRGGKRDNARGSHDDTPSGSRPGPQRVQDGAPGYGAYPLYDLRYYILGFEPALNAQFRRH